MAIDPVRLLDRSPRWVRKAVLSVTQGRGLLGRIFDRLAHRLPSELEISPPQLAASSIRLLIGPANEAEQGYQWARAFERHIDDVSAMAMMGFDPSGYEVRADLRVPTPVYLRSDGWHDSFEEYLRSCTHVLYESAIPLLGRKYRTDFEAEARSLAAAGVRVGVLFHGSDLRVPSQHRRDGQWSPFLNAAVPARLFEDRTRLNIDRTRALGLPAFVSTPDLLRYLPEAVWCPVVIDPREWQTEREGWRKDPPVVLHAPSNPLIKGSDMVEPALRRLEAEGIIKYRRVTGVKYEQMRQEYAEADIVLDQFLIGSYGVVACEALSAGCIVIAHVDDEARNAVRSATGLEVPIIEATVESLEQVLRRMAADTSANSELRERGIRFVNEVHDGRYSAEAVRGFLTVG
jgi:glycosyltransferase involved in cell wall biosynthesis